MQSTTTKVLKQLRQRPIPGSLASFCEDSGWIHSPPTAPYATAHTYEYGPLGASLRHLLRNAWWNRFITQRQDCVGFEASILSSPEVWKAAGHVDNFTDPITTCEACNERHRSDHLVKSIPGIEFIPLQLEELDKLVKLHKIACPSCKSLKLSPSKHCNLLFETNYQNGEMAYLRPETAQGILSNLPRVWRTTRNQMPIGIGQIGKAFRNELTGGPFIFRTREFEQMELEYCCTPSDASHYYQYWIEQCMSFLTNDCGISCSKLRLNEYHPSELAHYAVATTDIEFQFTHGWGELWGIANRSDYDLRQHHREQGNDPVDFRFNPIQDKPYFPHIIEPSVGLDRLFLAMLTNAYSTVDLDQTTKRLWMRLPLDLAPIQLAILPIVESNPALVERAHHLRQSLSQIARVQLDSKKSIGARYRRYDKYGTLYCLTIDDQSLHDETYAIRDRDTKQQQRLTLSQILQAFQQKRPLVQLE